MTSLIENLTGNTARFARYCVEKYSLEELVLTAKQGMDHEACSNWNLSDEQWQDAILSALEEIRQSK